jgi:hypothetical protein
MNVFYQNTSGQLMNEYWTPENGWRNQSLPGSSTITGVPTALENPSGTNMNVFYKTEGGQLFNEYWTPTGGWGGQALANEMVGP